MAGTSEDKGVKITDVEPGSSSYSNSIKKGDIIKKINRNPINSLDDYSETISGFEKGDVIMIRIDRAGSQGIRAFTIE